MPRPNPKASSSEALKRMRGQRQRDTGPETALRSLLHRRGLRFRVNHRLPGTRRSADLFFPGVKVAVFVDGCFWHACPEHGTAPKSNADWWREKLAANVKRDRDTDSRLSNEGWAVIRVWEHENVNDAADRVESLVETRKALGLAGTAHGHS